MKLKNLMFEGVDCVGKTSIIKEFNNKFPEYGIIKMSAPNSKMYAIRQYTAMAERLKVEQGLILDRGFISELVYAPIYRSYQANYIYTLINKIVESTILVYVTADEEVIKERFDNKFIKLKDISIIKNSFIEEFSKTKIKDKIYIDTTSMNKEEACQDLIEKLGRLEYADFFYL